MNDKETQTALRLIRRAGQYVRDHLAKAANCAFLPFPDHPELKDAKDCFLKISRQWDVAIRIPMGSREYGRKMWVAGNMMAQFLFELADIAKRTNPETVELLLAIARVWEATAAEMSQVVHVWEEAA